MSATLQPDAAADREIGPTLAQVIAFAPDREGMLLATDPRRDVSSAVTYDGSRSVTIKAAIPQVRFRNRDSGDRYAESARLGGDYYVAVQLSGSARVAVPVTISVAVHGEPDGRPRFARPVTSADRAGPAPTPLNEVTAPDPNFQGDGLPLTPFVVIGVAFLLLLWQVIWLVVDVVRKNRRR